MAKGKAGLHKQFRTKYGETGYSARQLSMASQNLDITRREKDFLEAFKRSGLAVNLESGGFVSFPGSSIRYLIPASKLDKLIDYMGLPVSSGALESEVERMNMVY